MSLPELRQFAYQRKSEYRSQRNYSCVEDAKNDHVDSVPFLLTPNKASLTSIPETPPSLQCIGSNNCRFVCVRRGERRKRYNRLSSSSEEEEEAKSKGDNVTPRKKVKSHTPVTIFSRLPASKRKKRILEDDANDKEEEVAGIKELACTKETSTVYHETIVQEEKVPFCLEQKEEDLRALCEIFPQYQRSNLEAKLCSNNGDLEKTVSSLVGSPSHVPKRKNCHQLIDSDDDSSLNKHRLKRINNAFASDSKKIKMDSGSSSNSDSDDLCSSATINSAKAQSGYLGKENMPSPMWLSARTKLQRFAFHKQDLKAKVSTSVADPDSKLENIQSTCGSHEKRNGPPLITDCESKPQIPSSVLPNASFCSAGPLSPLITPHPSNTKFNDESLDSTEEVGSYLADLENEFSDEQKEAILKFLNCSSEDELCNVPGCSLTKAKLLIQHLPFNKWEDLVDVLISTKGLSEQLLSSCWKHLEERKVLVQLLSKCQTISSSLQEKFLQLNAEASSKELMAGQYIAQPSLLSSSLQLKPYQLIGLNWLALLHSMDLNGILADEMGLGKTIQTISFLAYLHESGCQGPFLVIVPSSTLDNWARELEVWCPQFRVLKYIGSRAERGEIRCGVLYNDEEYDVILSTYGVCIGQVEDRKFLQKLSLQCLILDEGHMLKNMVSQRYYHLMKIKANRRVLLTGTPLQNNLLELMSLLSFVMPGMFQGYTDHLKKTFSRARKLDESSVYYKEQVSQAKQIMQPFILRRLKSEVMSELPSKDDSVEYCQLTELQQQLYCNVVDSSKNMLKNKAESENNSKSQNIIMELRKVANHPLLLLHHYTNVILRQMSQDILSEPTYHDADPYLVYEDMTVMTDFELHRLCLSYPALDKYRLSPTIFGESGKLKFLAGKLSELKMKNDRVLLFSQFTMMLDIIEVFLQQQSHTYLRLDGQTPASERQNLIDKFNQDSTLFVFLLSTKAGGLGINLTSANVVIIHDIDFNPYNDKQAEDRCHRIGQNRVVKVIRLVSRATIEEGMLQHAQMKLRLEKDITCTGEGCADVASLLKQSLGFTSDSNVSK